MLQEENSNEIELEDKCIKQQKCYNRSSVGFRFTSGVVPQKKEE